MSRHPLPQRRKVVTETIEFRGAVFHVSVGFYPDGRPGEVFVTGPKAGSAMAAVVADASVMLSILMQTGADPADLARSLGRDGAHGGRASIIGAIADLIAAGSAEGDR